MCKDAIVIMTILQSYALSWYRTNLLHPYMHTMEAIIHQHLYWPGMRHSA